MTTLSKDEIIAMAREAAAVYSTTTEFFSLSPNQLEKFAALCRAPLVAEVEMLKSQLDDYTLMMGEAHSNVLRECDALRAELSALRAGSGDAVAWVVYDEDKLPCHITIHPQMAQDHINDALDRDYMDAGKWTVRPVFSSPQLNPSIASNEEVASALLAADRCTWLANNFDGTQEPEVKQKLRDYAELLRSLAHPQPSAVPVDAEPVAWMHPSRDPHLVSHSAYTYGSASIPLYTHPQPSAVPVVTQPKPTEAISFLCRRHKWIHATSFEDAYFNGFRDAEKAHGIGENT